MAHKTWRISNRVLVSAISLLFGTAAHGVFYPARFDPGGNGFDIPGFNGNAVFDIDPGCVPGGSFTGWQKTNANINAGTGSCGAASLLSATVFLYSTDTDGPRSPEDVEDSFTIGGPVIGVYVNNGALAGVDTNPLGPVFGSDAYIEDRFWLQFVSGECLTGCTLVPPMQEPPGGGSEILTSAKVPGDPAHIFVNELDNPSVGAPVIFGAPCLDPTNCVVVPSSVPEPGILGLILAALGGGWLARRRKRSA